VTGFNSDQDIVRTSAAGFDDHLAKPLELDTLLKFIAMAGKKFGKATTA
jgi:CheY-like chemotaxis protein